MKIIIAGAGAVGTHLASLLARDNFDIVVVDQDPHKTQALTDNGTNDLMVINASPTSLQTLREAGTARAALFIAVTPHETTNLTACLLAHTLGAKRTVARIDNAEYVTPSARETFQRMGIDSLIYPEHLAAQEIIQALRYSWVRQYWEVQGGALVLLGIKLREEATILNQPLYQLCPPESPYHIVCIKRQDKTIIPRGADTLQLGDIAYFMTSRQNIALIRRLVGKDAYPDVRRAMVMGGGTTAVQLASLRPEWLDMRIIERSKERCHKLNELLTDEDIIVICGDGRDTDTMRDEGIADCQAFVALSDESERNILACLAAKRLGVRKTVAMVNALDYAQLAEKLDIGTIINKRSIAAGHIYKEMMSGEVESVKCLALVGADIAEFVAQEGSPITQSPVRELRLPEGVALGGLVRGGKGIAIGGGTQIEPTDTVVVIAREGLINKIDLLFAPPSALIKKFIDKLS